MISYQNYALDLIECFEECIFNLIPRVQNCVVDSLATSLVSLKVPMHSVGKYEIKVRHITFFLDNVKSWKVFKDEKEIQNFLTLIR